uniref:G_PROTEIN_RECEP_F1_2 domain-containing protein n=1 Tax=Haemonchus contortus TaxID=6289 RepID=A0A7I4YKD5_HAECO
MTNITELDYSSDEDGELYELTLAELIFWCIIYAVIALLAVIGNSLVIFITLMRLRTRAVTTYFIINLAFADLLTGIFAIPFKFQAALFQEWFLPSSLCQIVPYAETVSLSVSVFTLTASAVHEFRTTFFPKQGRLNTRSARSLVLLIWLVAALVSLPHGLFHRVYLIQDGDLIISQCRPVYADENWWKMYNVYLTIIHYFVPMIILDTAYTMIAIKIWGSTVNSSEQQTSNTHTNLNTEISNRKLMNMLMIVVACFSLCWFPLETYLLLNEIRPEINGWKYINILFFCSHWLAMSNSCLNPIIYGLFNNKYKREYRRVFNCLRCRADTAMEVEPQKFETEYSVGVLERKWPNPYACDGAPFYSETFQINLPPSTEITSAEQEKQL